MGRWPFVAGFLLLGVAWFPMAGLAQTNLETKVRTVEAKSARAKPPEPTAGSPVGFFRDLLAMSPAEREEALAGKAPQQALVIKAKLAEYELMGKEEREARLHQLELCRLMLPLMRLPAVARTERLEMIPQAERALVAKRLGEWDQLSLLQQTNALKSQTIISYFCRPERTHSVSQSELSKIMPPGSRQKLELDLPRWRDIEDAEQHKFNERLGQVLRLGAEERSKMLASLSPMERAQMQLTLKRFEALSSTQREQCIEGFGKLARLAPEDRQRFILDSDRWVAMTPEQRSLWMRMMARMNRPPSTAPIRPSVNVPRTVPQE